MEILSSYRCVIGEGPIFNEFDGRLYHVNASGPNEICSIDLKTGELFIRRLDINVAAMGFTRSGEMIISCPDGVFILGNDGSRTPLYDVEKYDLKYCNDAKVGPDGRFYIGTQSSKSKRVGDAVDGKLYSIDKNGEVKTLLDGLILSNGLDWSSDEKRFYHVDTGTATVKEYDFDKKSGDISFTGREIFLRGADGLTIDREDFLYVACWGEGHIAVVDTSDMQIKKYIDVPAGKPASCAFAGEDMKSLVIVSASVRTDVEKDENAGYTFVEKTSVKGRLPYLFG